MRQERDLQINLQRPECAVIELATEVVLKGGVVLGPTDTIYGLSCLALHEAALDRVVRLKQRQPEKGLLVLIPDLSWIPRLAHRVPARSRRLLDELWPGPVTVLLEASSELPRTLLGASGKVGIRWPRLPFLRHWLKQVGSPLVSTSANPSGEGYRGDPSVLRELFQDKVELFLEACPALEEAPPSSIVDLSESTPRIVREGAGLETIRHYLSG